MVNIRFEEPQDPSWIRWRERCRQATRLLVEAFETDQPLPQITDLYKGQASVYRSHSGPFHKKCSYCECKLGPNQFGDIEHFRPKREVREADNALVYLLNGRGEQKAHPGYFWLAYDWRNLLLSCLLCNKTPAMKSGMQYGKGSRFPVENVRATRPGEESQETPLLINPVFQDPADHFDMNTTTGALLPKTRQGETCIAILGLNRESLLDERKKAYSDAKGIFILLVLATLQSASCRERLQESVNDIDEGRAAYSFASRIAIQKQRAKLPLLA